MIVLMVIFAGQQQVHGLAEIKLEMATGHVAIGVVDITAGDVVTAEAVAVLGPEGEAGADRIGDRAADARLPPGTDYSCRS